MFIWYLLVSTWVAQAPGICHLPLGHCAFPALWNLWGEWILRIKVAFLTWIYWPPKLRFLVIPLLVHCILGQGIEKHTLYTWSPLPLVCSTLRVEWCFHWYSPSFRSGLQSLTQKHYGVECLFPQSFFPVFSFHFPSILSLWFKLGLRQRGWNGRGQESWEFCQ